MFTVRIANINDSLQMFNLEAIVYKSHYWSLNSFKSELNSKYSRYFLAESDKQKGEILGYAGYWIVSNEAHITTIVTHPDFRRNGIADKLLYTLIQNANLNKLSWLTLEVRASNIAAINLYRKYKFKELGIRKNYYQDNNEDAIILWSDILKP